MTARPHERSSRPEQSVRDGVRIAGFVVLALTFPLSVAMLVQLIAPTFGWPLALWVLALCIALHIAGVLGGWFPRVAFVIGAGVMLALALTRTPGLSSAALVPSALTFLLLTWQLAATQRRAIATAGLAVGLAGAGLITTMDALSNRSQDPLLIAFEAVALSAVVVASWASGRDIRRRRTRSAARAARSLEDAIAAERMRIGRDLHDVVSHSLTVMIAQAEAARVLTDTAASAAALDRVTETGRSAMDGLRGMLRVLDDADSDGSLAPIPDLRGIRALVDSARSTDHETSFTEMGTPRSVRPDAALALYRATQEALTNAVRHVQPPVLIGVTLAWATDTAVLTVRDDGGAGARVGDPGRGTGLVAMCERITQAGGELDIDQRHGWTVRVTIPTGSR